MFFFLLEYEIKSFLSLSITNEVTKSRGELLTKPNHIIIQARTNLQSF